MNTVKAIVAEHPELINMVIVDAIRCGQIDLAKKFYWHSSVDTSLVMHVVHRFEATQFIESVRRNGIPYIA